MPPTINKDSDACDRAVSHLVPGCGPHPPATPFAPQAPHALWPLSRKVRAGPHASRIASPCTPGTPALRLQGPGQPSHESPSARSGSVPGSATLTATGSSHSAPQAGTKLGHRARPRVSRALVTSSRVCISPSTRGDSQRQKPSFSVACQEGSLTRSIYLFSNKY